MPVARTVRLGDRELTRIGLGTNRLRDTPENLEFLRQAVQTGLDFIDTAHLYTGGASERAVGTALAPFPDGLTVASKVGYHPGSGRPETLRAELEESFERLQAETLPLVYLHRVDPDVAIEESLSVLREYRDDGRIEHVGVSAVGVDEIERARQVVPIAAVQNEYSRAERRHDDVVDFCEREGLLFVPYYPLHGPGTTQEKLTWLLERSPCIVPIPGTLSLEHLQANLALLDSA